MYEAATHTCFDSNILSSPTRTTVPEMQMSLRMWREAMQLMAGPCRVRAGSMDAGKLCRRACTFSLTESSSGLLPSDRRLSSWCWAFSAASSSRRRVSLGVA